MLIQMQSAMFAQRLEDHGDVGHLVGPFGTIPLDPRHRNPAGVMLLMPPVAIVVILVGGKKGDRYNVGLSLDAPNNETITFPVQHKTWPNKTYHRFLLRAQDVNILVRESCIWRVAILVNGEPTGELLLPAHWADEPPPPLPDFQPRNPGQTEFSSGGAA
jgi:hypothetical protein